MSSKVRALTVLGTVVALTAATQVGFSTAAHADPVSDCTSNVTEKATLHREIYVPGNGKLVWPKESDEAPRLRAHDVVRFKAGGSVQIATWGDSKGAWGNGWNDDLAPDNGRWPAPGEPKYALLVRPLFARAMVLDGPDENLLLRPGRWYVAGKDTECLQIVRTSSNKDVTPSFEFKINDDNIGDNNDGFDVSVRMWRPCIRPLDSNC